MAEEYIHSLKDRYDYIIRAVQTRRAAQKILVLQKDILKEKAKAGLIDNKEYLNLKKSIDRKIRDLVNMAFKWKAPDFNSFVV